jgi:hypothetical protein
MNKQLTREKMTPPTATLIRLDAVAINAPDLAFGYFIFYGLPGSSAIDHFRYTGNFVPSHMIKLKTAYVGLTTINTYMFG